MATPFYVAPEQMMKDRAEFAQKGIARGRALVAITWADGVLFVGENPSRMLYKTSEIYDRIGFAAVGKYNEYDALRVAGIRLADVKGYQYARQDVAAKSLANAYSQSLGAIFMGGDKPYEVELLIAEVGERAGTEIFHIHYDGSIVDEQRYVAIGGESDALRGALDERWQPDMPLPQALAAAHGALTSVADRGAIPPGDLEVSGLDRTRARRRFFRLDGDEIRDLLAAE